LDTAPLAVRIQTAHPFPENDMALDTIS